MSAVPEGVGRDPLEVRHGREARRKTIRPKPKRKAALIVPVAGVSASDLSNSWGAPRSGGRKHKGIDIFANSGTPVLAAIGGTVTVAADSKRYAGIRVWVKGDDGRFYFYAHLQSESVRPGQRVVQGQVLGRVGNTGNARGTRPHLHFSINTAQGRETGTINPYMALRGAREIRSGDEISLRHKAGAPLPDEYKPVPERSEHDDAEESESPQPTQPSPYMFRWDQLFGPTPLPGSTLPTELSDRDRLTALLESLSDQISGWDRVDHRLFGGMLSDQGFGGPEGGRVTGAEDLMPGGQIIKEDHAEPTPLRHVDDSKYRNI